MHKEWTTDPSQVFTSGHSPSLFSQTEIPFPYCRLQADGSILSVNQEFMKAFGPEADFIGRSFYAIFPAGTQEAPIGEFEQYIPPVRGQAQRWFQWKCSETNFGEKHAFAFDITPYRSQMENISQREMLFSNIFEYTTDFLSVFRVVHGDQLILESFNRTVDSGTGEVRASTFIGKNLSELIDFDHKEIINHYKKCLETKQHTVFDEKILVDENICYLTTTIIPILNRQNEVERVVAFSRDISRFKETEQELIKAKNAAEIANLSKSEFLASMSHELRTPLNVVVGISHLLETSNLNLEQKRQVDSIHQAGKMLLNLIEDILDISKIEAGRVILDYRPFSVHRMLDEVCALYSQQLKEKNINLIRNFDFEENTEIVADPIRVRQILNNFISNAVKFTKKGAITLDVSLAPASVENKSRLICRIIDTGIGIDSKNHEKIFKKFSQVHSGLNREYGGTGLGLVISKQLTNLMGGEIGFQSEVGNGSEFWFNIPVTVSFSLASTNYSRFSYHLPNRKLQSTGKILAVDDSSDNLYVLDMFLKRLGYEAKLVHDGKSALKTLQKEQDYDLILMDIQMPGMDGYETTSKIRRIKNKNSKVPVIALTANATVGDSEKCFEVGMNDYLTKPYDIERIGGMIEKWMNKQKAHQALDQDRLKN